MTNRLFIRQRLRHLVLLVVKTPVCLVDMAHRICLSRLCPINYISHFIKMVEVVQVKGLIQVPKIKPKQNLDIVLVTGLETIKNSGLEKEKKRSTILDKLQLRHCDTRWCEIWT